MSKKRLLLVLGIVITFFGILLLIPGVPGGDDGYRHVTMAHQIATNWSDVRSQGWHIRYLSPYPADIWFLYDLLLAPLTLILPLIIALKLYSTLWLGGIILVFLKILDQLEIRFQGWWLCVLLLGSWSFIMRLSLGRPLSASVFFLLLAVFFALKKNPWGLLVASAGYTLAYSIFFLILTVPGAAVLAFQDKKVAFKLFAFGFLGAATGFVLNPSFPHSAYFAWLQAVLVPIVGTAQHLPIGTELFPMDLISLASISLVAVLWGLSLWRSYSERKYKRLTEAAWLFLILSLFNALVMTRLVRQLEYFVPLATIFCAIVLGPLLGNVAWREKFLAMRKHFMSEAVLIMILLSFGSLFVANLSAFLKSLSLSPDPTQYRGAAVYALEHGGERASVFNTQWDHYQQLYFWNPQSTYMSGLDPTFLYLSDQKKYWLWWHISNDELLTCDTARCEEDIREAKSISETVFGEFGFTYLLIEKLRTPNLWKSAESVLKLRLVYGDDNTKLFAR